VIAKAPGCDVKASKLHATNATLKKDGIYLEFMG